MEIIMKRKLLIISALLLQGILIVIIEKGILEDVLLISIFTLLSFISVYDWKTGLVSLRVNISIFLLSMLYSYFAYKSPVYMVIGMICASIPFFFAELFYQIFINKQKDEDKFIVGGADIILAASVGMVLGWQRMILAILLSSILVVITSRIKGLKKIPYVPFIHAGFLIAYIWGAQLIGWYLNFRQAIIMGTVQF
jgi:leader peptidase (prepilin peptidase)/N-methyltransferase